jgi:hypothetical protein
MFRGIKLYFTNKPYYEQRKRYMKRQKAVRKKLKELATDFCPWSGCYMHEVIKTMLEFYFETYKAGDCCWCESTHTEDVARTLFDALLCAENLDKIDDLEAGDLIAIAEAIPDFEQFKIDYETKFGSLSIDGMLGYAAYEFLEQYYTRKMYNLIGEHIWEWWD